MQTEHIERDGNRADSEREREREREREKEREMNIDGQ